jgi:hypothetical protein
VEFGYRDPQTSLRGFIEQRVYCSNPRHLEDLEHNTEQAVVGTDQQTLREYARNSVKKVNTWLQKGSGHFQHLLYLHITI